MELATEFRQLGIALGLGLLVGLQRERTNARLAGFRTFPLITVFGTICALLAQTFGGWVVAAGMAGLIGLLIMGNLRSDQAEVDPGLTSEIAMLVMFAIGAFLAMEKTAPAIALGGTVAVLLHLKPEMHRFAARLGKRDFKAVMQFALISLVILPVLPNEYHGPYAVLNPFKIWLMVVLIVGISLGGYIIYKILGPRAGTLASGLLGGLISSTATTVSYARSSKQTPGSVAMATFVITMASAVVFARVLALIGATAPAFLSTAWPPLAVMMGWFGVLAMGCWIARRGGSSSMPEQENPSELKPALLFAGVYAVVLVATAAAKDHFGQNGLYAVAVLSGLTDMDAITLSVTQMVSAQNLSAETGWRLILVASLSNLVFKTGTVAAIGGSKLALRITLLFASAFAGGTLLLIFWSS
jgi:uncharacterized membrane protein (DUF4010 family)